MERSAGIGHHRPKPSGQPAPRIRRCGDAPGNPPQRFWKAHLEILNMAAMHFEQSEATRENTRRDVLPMNGAKVRDVLDCASPLALSIAFAPESARGLAQSKTRPASRRLWLILLCLFCAGIPS